MNALRADARMAVQKAKALAAMAWASPISDSSAKKEKPH
jgi:hypothetical protein